MRNLEQEHWIMEERKRKLLQSAKLHQLYREAQTNQTTFGDRLLRLIGDLMITGGTRLKAQSEPLAPLPLHLPQN